MVEQNSLYRTLECRPDNYQGWYNQGNILRSHNNLLDALFCYEKALEYYPNDYFSWYYHGKVLEELGRYNQAIKSFQEACAIEKDNYWAWYSASYILQEKIGHHKEAIPFLLIALKNNPSDYWATYRLGKAYLYQKKYLKALDFFQQALKIRPNDYWCYYRCGQCRQKLNQLDLAKINYQKSLQIKLQDYWSIASLITVAESQGLFYEVVELSKNISNIDSICSDIEQKISLAHFITGINNSEN
ncbi:TPR domain protein, putative component of TonB system [Cyanobacterium sp. HL-69]|uniref:tetratricopeptide repeat protein n=1 Tax=Cyanobacterium sp. HL-69 TaxID=2054282 RepID=UPI000CA1AF14|nr:TPR domain protein, putative component of TonB system [Cyanobacterium sp. HL-69]